MRTPSAFLLGGIQGLTHVSSSVQRDNAARTELRIPNTTDQKIGQVHFQKARLNLSPMIGQNRPTQKWNEIRAAKSGRNKVFTKAKKKKQTYLWR